MNSWISVQTLNDLEDSLSSTMSQEIELPQLSPFELYLAERPVVDIQPHTVLLPPPSSLNISCIKAIVTLLSSLRKYVVIIGHQLELNTWRQGDFLQQ